MAHQFSKGISEKPEAGGMLRRNVRDMSDRSGIFLMI
jgi:hypothetical protein